MVSSSFVFSRAGRSVKFTIGGTAVATTAIFIPPKEALPVPLLHYRVLLEGVGRVGRCAYVGSQILFDYKWNLRGPHGESQEAWNVVHQRSAERLVSLAETNGGLYVKAGQIFANMSHILPRQYCVTMAALQDSVVKRPFSEIVATIEQDLGCPITDVFSYLDPTPIAAASLAQVHRGTLRKECEDVAVKVQYIDIAHRFRGDMRTIQLMLNISGYFFKGYDLSELVMKLNNTVANELDFLLESENCRRIERDLKAGGFGDRVVTAKIFLPYTTRRVLTAKLVKNATKISDLSGITERGISPQIVATWLYDALSYQFFVTGFIHADPHAGNVLVHRLPNGQPQVVLLDFGLCTELSKEQRLDLAVIWTSAVMRNSPKLKEVALKYGCENYALLGSCFLQHPYDLGSSESRLTMKSSQEKMREQVKHKMYEVNHIVSSMPKEYALVLRSILASKAINRELHYPVNRPLRMLRYSLPVANGPTSQIRIWLALLQAWWSETFSSLVLSYAKWRNPEMMEAIDESLQLQICG